MADEEGLWSADVPVSMPLPQGIEGLVPMRGFVFTGRSLVVDLDEADYDRFATPDFAPEDYPNEIEYGDEDIDDDDLFAEAEWY